MKKKKQKPDPRFKCCACGNKPDPAWNFYMVCGECLSLVRNVQNPVNPSMLYDLAEAVRNVHKKHGHTSMLRFVINGFKAE